jgi:hypothetical protein
VVLEAVGVVLAVVVAQALLGKEEMVAQAHMTLNKESMQQPVVAVLVQ